jgi:nicotinamidase-related amidase
MKIALKYAVIIIAAACIPASISGWSHAIKGDPARPHLNVDAARVGPTVLLDVRRLTVPSGPGSTELDAAYVSEREEIDLSRTALVVVDAWATHPTEGWAERAGVHMREYLVPLLRYARDGGMTVIHMPNGAAIADLAMPIDGEVVLGNVGVSTADGLSVYLHAKGIDTLIYCGYASNWCVTTRPMGLIFMQREGFNVLIVRDGSIGFETPESYDGQWGHRMAVSFVEQSWGASTTVADIGRALDAGD